MASRILIADRVATNRIALTAMLQSTRYSVLQAETGTEALRIARQAKPDIILLSGGYSTAELLEPLKSDIKTRGIPTIRICPPGYPQARLDALRLGATEVMTRPLHAALLLARIRSVLRSQETAAALAEREDTVRDLGFAEHRAEFQTQARVALITRTRKTGVQWRATLSHAAPQFSFDIFTADDFGERDGDLNGDLFVLQAVPDRPTDALRLLSELRSAAASRHAGIVVVHNASDADTAAIALDVGANDVIDAGFEPDELALRLDQQLRNKRKGDRLRASVDEGLRLAMVDPLTGLFNRRYALAHARRVMAESGPGRSLGVILADIDRFKALNDRWGHAAGDSVLVEVAQRLRQNTRDKDTVARIGGEEFLVLLPDAEPSAILTAARRLCTEIRGHSFDLGPALPPALVTASLGVALAFPGDDIEEALRRADHALYSSKESGRDMVTVDDQHAA